MGYKTGRTRTTRGEGEKQKWGKFGIQRLGQIFERAKRALRIGRKKEPEARGIVELDF